MDTSVRKTVRKKIRIIFQHGTVLLETLFTSVQFKANFNVSPINEISQQLALIKYTRTTGIKNSYEAQRNYIYVNLATNVCTA